MSEELTKITLEQLGKEYALAISERDLLREKLELAKEAMELAYSDLEPYEWTDMPDGRIVLETVERLRDVLAEIDNIE